MSKVTATNRLIISYCEVRRMTGNASSRIENYWVKTSNGFN
jgi:hypothetical protein